MSIGYVGHCRLTPAEAQKRIDHIRAAHPEWFEEILHLGDARPPQKPFERELSQNFGVDPASIFMLDVYDKDRFDTCLQDALEFTYQVFGTKNLVLTRELDSIRKPEREYEGMAF